MAQESSYDRPESELREIQERLRGGKLTDEDVKVLTQLAVEVERASKALRAAIAE